MINFKKIKLSILGILVVASFLVWSAYFSIRPDSNLKVIFFDVGQGDASFIETPNHYQILIDGGPDNSVLEKLGRAMPFYDRSLDILIITHPDSDHLAGAVEIIKNYEVGLVIVNGKKCTTSLCGEFEKIVQQKNIKVMAAAKGQKIDLDDNAVMDIFAPNIAQAANNKEGNNNFSVISRLVYGADSFLFMGDAEDKEEMELLSAWPDLTAEILKIGHHGSKNSSNQLFLDKIKPKISIISVGAKNRYGHPTGEVLDKLKKIGSEILRTDLGRDIAMETEGKGIIFNAK